MRKIFRIAILYLLILTACGTDRKSGENNYLNILDISDKKMAFVGIGENIESHPPLSEVIKESDLIVYGEVSDVNYMAVENGNIISCETIKILDTLSGDISGKNEITVWKQGGVVTLRMFIDSYDEEYQPNVRERFQAYSNEQMDEFLICGYGKWSIPSEIGMKFVLCLKKDDTLADYQLAYDYYGEYLEVESDVFFTTSSGITYDMYVDGSYRDYFEGHEEDINNIWIKRENLYEKFSK